MGSGKIVKTIYSYITDEKRIETYRRLDAFAAKVGGKLYTKTLGQYKYKLRYDNISEPEEISQSDVFEKHCWNLDKPGFMNEQPLISVIVPNYNHAAFLEERLESIYNQTYQNFEVILLDDCSTDNSREILSAYAERYQDRTVTIFNEVNSGRVFKQWNKGLQAAKGDLIWIAESDDYCELDFLEKMIPSFRTRSVILAFARSVFMQEGKKIWSTEEYLHDLPNLKWDAPFMMSAHELVLDGFAIHNVIPNVSSAVFRNIGKVPDEVEEICRSMKLSGDWIFYLNMIKGSVVSYTNETTNYYRIHPQSTSLKVQKTEDYYIEFEQVSCYISRNYKIHEGIFYIVLENLKRHYESQHSSDDDFDVANYYSVEKIMQEQSKRKPNIVMACYGLRSGGGETYPIYLANEMRRQGLAVTLLNFDMEPAEKRIVELVASNVPVVNLKHTDYIGQVLYHLGADVVHSHHASVDYALSRWLVGSPKLAKHIITLHGMYEAIEPEDCTRVIRETGKTCFKYIYIADKNLDCFKERDQYRQDKFVKLPNGLPVIPVCAVDRKSLHIEEDDFVYVLASRGLPEKGWKEAIEAVTKVNESSSRKVQLVILGDGECRGELQAAAPDFVHFEGTVSNVRDYFMMGDAGLLPSRFKGESYPLVIIECLMTGKPVVATDIAEVANQIRDEEGNMAGVLIPLEDWHFSTDQLADRMKELANDEELYNTLKQNIKSVSRKFDISMIIERHVEIYQEACKE